MIEEIKCNCLSCTELNDCGCVQRYRFKTKQEFKAFKASSSKKCKDYQLDTKLDKQAKNDI